MALTVSAYVSPPELGSIAICIVPVVDALGFLPRHAMGISDLVNLQPREPNHTKHEHCKAGDYQN